MAILQKTDFAEGEFSIPQNQYTKLDKFISKYEEYYLLRMLGLDLYNTFKADLTPTTPQIPITLIYTTIFNKLSFEEGNCLYISEGIKEMLIQFVYYHFMLESEYKKTISGVVKQESELATNQKYEGFNLISSHNNGVKNYNIIQNYINFNSDIYPTFKGVNLYYSSGI